MERKINTDATGNTVWGSPARVSKRVRAHTRASGGFFFRWKGGCGADCRLHCGGG